MLLSVFTKTGTRFKSHQDTRNQRTLNSWTNSEVQKVSSESWSVSWSECSSRVHKVVHKQTQKTQEHYQKMQDICDMSKCSIKYICTDQISNKGMDKEPCQKGLQGSFKTMNTWSTRNILKRLQLLHFSCVSTIRIDYIKSKSYKSS